MAPALVGLVALLIILWFMHKYVQANPRGMAWLLQKGGGVAALVAVRNHGLSQYRWDFFGHGLAPLDGAEFEGAFAIPRNDTRP